LNVGTCSIENVQLDITDLLIDTVAGGDVDTPPALSCIVDLGGTVTITWVSNEEVHYSFAYTLDVDEAQCNNTIENLIRTDQCGQTYDVVVNELGPFDGDGASCDTR
jgi:hypothetical protein